MLLNKSNKRCQYLEMFIFKIKDGEILKKSRGIKVFEKNKYIGINFENI